MNIFVFTKKETSVKPVFAKNVQFPALSEIKKIPVEPDDFYYLDATGLDPDAIKKTLTQIKKQFKDTSWGIIDPKGCIKDPAFLFFDGASDYLGPEFFKKTNKIDTKRLQKAQSWRKAMSVDINKNLKSGAVSENEKSSAINKGFLNNGIKLPAAGTFPGWKKIPSGKTLPFYLLYCSLQGKTTLDVRLGENTFAQIHKRFYSYLTDTFIEADGLHWMDTGKDCLFLLPPKIKAAEIAIEACIRMIINAPLITLETLGLSVPVNFVFALHYGSLGYKPPGKTGTVVSDAVNAIFHLGVKKAECGRLTISGDIPGSSVPKSLEDSFVPAGEYEGRKIFHTKKFSYEKPWV